MSKKDKRICKCCGKEYEYCPHCGKHSDELWKNITDTEECREILNVVSAYNIGKANKDQVKKVLDRFNVKDYNKYKASIAAVLNKLFAEEPKPVPVVSITEDVATNTLSVEEVNKEEFIPKVEEPVVEAQPTYSKSARRRNNKRKKHYMDVDSNKEETSI